MECGFDHGQLMAMSEEEFCFWRDERAEYDRLIAEAAKAAREKEQTS
ncbi:hypothetical protein ACUXV3_12270 [Roseobacteraceae bacterium NS-SX3]